MENLKSKIIKGGTWLTFSSFLARILGIGTTLLTLSILSVFEYGLYQLVLAAFGMMDAFRLGGLDSLVGADAARMRGDGKYARLWRIFWEFFIFQLTVGIILFLISFFGATLISNHFGASIGGYVRIISILFLVVPIEKALALILSTNLEFKSLSLFTAIEEFLKFFCVVFFVWWLHWGVAGILWATVLASSSRFIFFIPRGWSLFKELREKSIVSNEMVDKKIRYELVSMLAKHGKWGVLTDYANDIISKGKFWLIKFFTNTEVVAIYSLAEGLYGQIFSLVPLYSLLFPLMPQEVNNRDRMKKLVMFSIKYGTIIYVGVIISSFFFVPIFLSYVLPRYLSAVFIFRIMIFAAFTTATANATSSFLFAHQDQKASFGLLLLQGLLIGSIGSVLIWKMGITGAALSFVLMEFLYIGSRLIYVLKKYPDMRFGWNDMVNFSEDERIFFSNLRKKLTLGFIR